MSVSEKLQPTEKTLWAKKALGAHNLQNLQSQPSVMLYVFLSKLNEKEVLVPGLRALC